MDENAESVRLDVWLWAARFFKTRALAKQAVEGGKIAAGGSTVHKPARPVRHGDRLSVRRGEERFDIEVLAVAGQRGPAAVAQQLYREDEASIARRQAEREQRRLEGAGQDHPARRPDKKSRRQLRDLSGKAGGGDGLPPWWPR